MSNGRNRIAAIAALGVFSLVVPAFADGDANASGDQTGDSGSIVKELPKWEPYASTDPDAVEETFFRMSQDFVTTSELGVRRLGQVPIWPRGDMRFGRVRIFPYLRQAAEYDTNVFKRGHSPDRPETARESGWTHVSQLGVNADTVLKDGRVRITGSADSRWMSRSTRHQEDDWEIDTQLGAFVRVNRTIWTKVGVSYSRRSDPTSAEFTQQFNRTNKGAFARLGIDKDPAGTRARYEFGVDVRDAESREDSFNDLDRTETSYFGKISYPVWRDTTRAFARARYREDQRESKRKNDGNNVGVDFGIEGSIPISEGEYRGLRGSVSVGFDHTEFDNETFRESGVEFNRGRARSDSNTNANVTAALQYIANSRTTIDLRALHTNQFTFFGNYQVVSRLDLSATYNLSQKMTLRASGFWERTDPSGTLAPEPTDGRFAPNGSARRTNRGGAGLGLRYPLEDWIDLDVSVDWERRNSNAERSYSNYRGVVGVTFYLSGLKTPATLKNSSAFRSVFGESSSTGE